MFSFLFSALRYIIIYLRNTIVASPSFAAVSLTYPTTSTVCAKAGLQWWQAHRAAKQKWFEPRKG